MENNDKKLNDNELDAVSGGSQLAFGEDGSYWVIPSMSFTGGPKNFKDIEDAQKYKVSLDALERMRGRDGFRETRKLVGQKLLFGQTELDEQRRELDEKKAKRLAKERLQNDNQ